MYTTSSYDEQEAWDTSGPCVRSFKDDEKEILERARDLDPAALGAVYDYYAPKIYAYVCRRLGCGNSLQEQMVAEDLTAEVFVRMLKAIQRGKAWRTSFSGWLYRIAHNLVVDHFRSRSRSQKVSLDDAPPLLADEGDPVEIVERKLDHQRLGRALGCLTEDQALVIALRFLEGLSTAEVAAIMNRSEGSVKGLQYRAAVSLRRMLAVPSPAENGEQMESADAQAGLWHRQVFVATSA